jgi:hypothetical protein
MWLREKSSIEYLRKDTYARYFRSHYIEKEKDPYYSPTEEGIPSQIRICIEPMTPCASRRSKEETRTVLRSIIVSGGIHNNSQNSGSSSVNRYQSTSPKVRTT